MSSGWGEVFMDMSSLSIIWVQEIILWKDGLAKVLGLNYYL